ncbi:MAG: response regulator transcription factor [Clostridia bacterium]|nr:response regulator transcription factor [Clostridia bacterium]
MRIKILIAEDDSIFRRLICDILTQKGYHVLEAKNGREAMDLFFSHMDIALCIFDVMMPIYSGWEVLRDVREKSDVPVMMLTALGDEQNEVKGLSKGADDYISKPFSYPIFVARVEALLRTVKKQNKEKQIMGDLVIDYSNHRVWVRKNEIILNNKEYHLLVYFMNNKGIVLGREKILDNIWGYDFDGDMRTVDAHVKMLRNKLGLCCDYIRTIRGTGYIFEVENEEEH